MTNITPKLFQSFQEGDKEAFVKIMKRLHPRVLGFAKSVLRVKQDAEEITQDVFVKLWQNRERIESYNNINAYLYVITRNQMYDFLRANREPMMRCDNEEVVENLAPDVASEYEAKELELLITLEVEKMSPQRRKVFDMSVREGLSHDEISAKLKITNKTVSNHLHYVLKELKKSLPIMLSMALFALF